MTSVTSAMLLCYTDEDGQQLTVTNTFLHVLSREDVQLRNTLYRSRSCGPRVMYEPSNGMDLKAHSTEMRQTEPATDDEAAYDEEWTTPAPSNCSDVDGGMAVTTLRAPEVVNIYQPPFKPILSTAPVQMSRGNNFSCMRAPMGRIEQPRMTEQECSIREDALFIENYFSSVEASTHQIQDAKRVRPCKELRLRYKNKVEHVMKSAMPAHMKLQELQSLVAENSYNFSIIKGWLKSEIHMRQHK
eukprot:gb/GFBE01036743.1/.p1 GENE.gb/GFBE01036743.1/~~gb/GFBE01036743.1/.p1  ORF type:complete len:244 (+),score=41.15 gb/GFBE01036743.1/:1-732(+)